MGRGSMTPIVSNAVLCSLASKTLKPEREQKIFKTEELQIVLKNFNIQKDKLWVGSVKLPELTKTTLRVCVLSDAQH